MYLSVFVRRRDGHPLVDVAGDVDISSAPWLQQRLLHLLGGDGPRLLVDLSGVTFIDCFAARALAETCRRADQQACSIQFIALSKHVQRVVELTGLAGELPVTGLAAAGRPARGT
jgi:anti-sigma B factor antagonist